MPRSNSSKSSSTTKPSSPVVLRNPYSSVANTTPSVTVPTPTFGQTLKEGFAFGTGSALAHRFFNPFPTGAASTAATPVTVNHNNKKPCEAEQIAFEACLKTRSMDAYCDNEQLAFTTCIRDSATHQ